MNLGWFWYDFEITLEWLWDDFGDDFGMTLGWLLDKFWMALEFQMTLGYLWNDFEFLSVCLGLKQIVILIVKYFLSKTTIWELRAWVSKNKQKILTWKRSSFVNMRVPWLSMCQSLRRTHDSWKNNKTKIINDKYVYVCVFIMVHSCLMVDMNFLNCIKEGFSI